MRRLSQDGSCWISWHGTISPPRIVVIRPRMAISASYSMAPAEPIKSQSMLNRGIPIGRMACPPTTRKRIFEAKRRPPHPSVRHFRSTSLLGAVFLSPDFSCPLRTGLASTLTHEKSGLVQPSARSSALVTVGQVWGRPVPAVSAVAVRNHLESSTAWDARRQCPALCARQARRVPRGIGRTAGRLARRNARAVGSPRGP